MIHDERNAAIGGRRGTPILALVDIRLLDLLIVARGETLSFAEWGLL
jgi:DNA repair protein RadC